MKKTNTPKADVRDMLSGCVYSFESGFLGDIFESGFDSTALSIWTSER